MSLIHTGAISWSACIPLFVMSTIACSASIAPSSAEGNLSDAGSGAAPSPTPVSNSQANGDTNGAPGSNPEADPVSSSVSALSRHRDGGGSPDASTHRADGGTFVGGDSGKPTPPGSGGGKPSGPGGASLGGCVIYPPGSAWNTNVSQAALSSVEYTLDPGRHLHADWGTTAEGYGIPWNSGTAASPLTVDMTLYADQSDKLKGSCSSDFCYPIPSGAKIESPGDSHLLFLDTGGAPNHCMLYELWQASPASSGYSASCGAIFHLDGTSPRPAGWTSADAAGLAILPGLVKYQEVKSGHITHAFRFTMQSTSNGYVAPATHEAATGGSTSPPMGTRVRLRGNFDISPYSHEAQTVLVAMQQYGMILADNGSNWYVSGDQDDGWAQPASDGNGTRDSVQRAMNSTTGADFEVLDSGPITYGN